MFSFLKGRSQKVKVVNNLSDVCDLASSVVQFLVLGLILYVMTTNSLLAAVKLTCETFVDDLKFVIDVVKKSSYNNAR